MTSYLTKILAEKKEYIEQEKRKTSIDQLKAEISDFSIEQPFRIALEKNPLSIIAEIKFRSPSKGILHVPMDPKNIALEYQKNGAAAISVLTESVFFAGANEHLMRVKESVSIPVLRKDFIIDPWQIYESKKIGADAILLICAALEKNELTEYLKIASSLHLSSVVEVHNELELDHALDAGAEIIGINNRDLTTFVTDIRTTISLQQKVPKGKIVISESGIHSHADIQMLAENGIHCFLIGESILMASDKGEKIQELLGEQP